MWKKILLVIIVVGLLGLAGATVYVNNIDWNMHKDKISTQFSNVTGKQVEFKGSVSFNIFPSPYLEATSIQIYNAKSGSGEKVLLADIKKLVATLSIKSLLSGNFNVERMNVIEPEFFVELYPNGKLNWQSSEGSQQNFSVDNVEISMDSVTVERAKMNIKSEEYNINAVLDNLNAEVISQSLFGPYRIEGSYIKDKTMGGFAISLGQFSESFATSVNAVLSHLQSDSYVRFDGTILLSNDAINGNLIFESQNPVNFINSNFRDVNISEDYEYPLALSIELKTDKSQIGLSNIVLKYGQTAGAGNILIPRLQNQIGDVGEQRRKIDAVFNMTELQLDPMVKAVGNFAKKYDGQTSYVPDYGFDVIADLKSIKTTYNNEVIREFDLSLDFINNILKIQNLSAMLPGDANTKLKGEVFSIEKTLTYNFDLNSNINDMAKLSGWLGYPVEVITPGTYKKASVNGNVSGTLNTIKISPLDLMLDKTTANAQIALVRGEAENRWFVIANMDNLNFDSYFAALPKDLENASWEEKFNHVFAKTAGLNSLDLQFRYALRTGIYGNIPFENLETEANLKGGILKIADFNVQSFATAGLNLKGELSGFGSVPQVKNMNYSLNIKDTSSFLERLSLEIPAVNFSNLNTFTSTGIVTGGFKRAAVKTVSKLGNVDIVYNGETAKQNNIYNLSGAIDLRAPDFVKFVNNMSVAYNPNYPLGLLRLNANIKGNPNALMLKGMSANIGANSFEGDLVYQKKDQRNVLKADLKINRFEFEKFFYNRGKNEKESFRTTSDGATFLAKPKLDLAKIDYSWLDNWDMEGRFSVDNLSLNNKYMTNASWIMGLNKDVIKVAKLNAEFGKGTVDGNLELNVPLSAKFSGMLNFKNIEVNKDIWSGSIYGLTAGKFDGVLKFDTSAASADNILADLNGSLKFDITKPIFKGWSLNKIEDDLRQREVSKGFAGVARDMLSKGETAFNTLSGELVFNAGTFSTSNTVFSADTYDVDVVAEGNLKGWVVNSTMNIDFKDVPNVTGFDFSLDGGLNIPALDVDVSKVDKVYDSHWENIANQAKAEEEARIKTFRELMDKEQEKAQQLKERLDNKIIQDFTVQSKLARDSYMKGQYAEINNQISKVKNMLSEVFAKDKMTTIDNAVIDGLKKDNAAIAKSMANIEKSMSLVHAKDVKLRINQSYNDIFNLFNKSKNLSSKYLDTYGAYDKRLAAINTSYRIRDDKNIAGLRKQIEDSLLAIDSINTEIGRSNVLVQSISNVTELEKYAENFDQAHKQAFDEYTKIETVAKNLADYTEAKVAAEENKYYQRLKDEEMKKKLEENVGQISTSSGKKVTIERDYDDIQKSENALRNEEVKVLDFSTEDSGVSGSITSPVKNRRRSNANPDNDSLIIRIDESIPIESGGVIVRP